MNDSFGNYLIQKIIENLSMENLYKVIDIVSLLYVLNYNYLFINEG